MLRTCPICEEESDVTQVTKKEKILVRGEPIETTTTYYKCSRCGTEYLNTMDDDDSLERAYRKFRKKNNMLQPEGIRKLRKSIGLTQGELSDLLGFGKVTICRYENGSLQSKPQDTQLRMLEDPRFVLDRIKENPSALPPSKKSIIIERLKNDIKRECIVDNVIEEYLAPDKIDEWNGFVPFVIDKVNNLILYFCKEGCWKTKINKLLFYAEFKHFKEYTKGITGARYKRLPLGPVPELYETILGKLVDEGMLEMTELFFESGTSGLEYKTIEDPNLTIFSDTELEVVAKVKNHFKNYGAKELSDFSHAEKGYKETSPGQYINYNYAKDLKI